MIRVLLGDAVMQLRLKVPLILYLAEDNFHVCRSTNPRHNV